MVLMYLILTAGTHTITKGTTNVYVYVMSYAVDGGDTTVTTTTETTTEATTMETTDDDTEATTKKQQKLQQLLQLMV